jgi:hypothetical protein
MGIIYLPDNSKKDDKKQSTSPAPKGEDKPIKPDVSIKEKWESLVQRNTKEYFDFLQGGIEYPTKFDKFIPKNINDENIGEYELAQTAYIAKTSAYIATHLQRWMKEKVVKGDKIDLAYRITSSPFAGRVMVIERDCEGMLNTLPSILPAFQERFREKYLQLCSVAKKADENEIRRVTPITDINCFKLAAGLFNDTVMSIYSDACAKIHKLTQPAKENIQADLASEQKKDEAGDAAKKRRPALSDFKDVEQAIIKHLGKNKLKYQAIICGSDYNDGGHIKSAIQNLKKAAIIKHERPFYSLYPQHYYLLKSKK